MKLKELVEQLTIFSVQGNMDVDITGINMNTRSEAGRFIRMYIWNTRTSSGSSPIY